VEPVNTNEAFYGELWLLIRSATAGLLDWQTLVAWLFCNRVTTSSTLNAVPEDRRFELSRYQDAQFRNYKGRRVFESEEELINRVQEIFNQDKKNLASKTQGELPYDHGNNIMFPGETLGASGGPGKGPGADGGESSKAKQEDRWRKD
jgi:hypothetical protein